MSSTRRALTSSTARLVWGGLAVALGAGLALSFFLAKGSIDGAESDAEARAVDRVNTALFEVVTPDQLERRVAGADERAITAAVQAGILIEEDVTRVRIWNPDAELVFSTDPVDQTGEVVAAGDPQIAAALGGETVSVPTEAVEPAIGGLAGTSEQLYRTFVPLRLAGQTDVSGVAEVDQRYAAIEQAASEMWRTVRIVLIAGLVVVAIMFLVSLIPSRGGKQAAVGLETAPTGSVTREAMGGSERLVQLQAELRTTKERAARTEAELREAMERLAAVQTEAQPDLRPAEVRLVQDLEARATSAEKRAAAAEAALQAAQRVAAAGAPSGGVPPHGGAPEPGAGPGVSGPELAAVEARARAAEQERELLSTEIARLRTALAERDAALASQPTTGEDPETEKLQALLAEQERRTTESEQRIAEAAGRALDAEERLSQMEEALRAAQATTGELEAKLAESEAMRQAGGTGDAVAGTPPAVAGNGEGEVRELQARVQELEDLRRAEVTELQRAHESLANTQFEATQARRRVKELEERLRELEVDGLDVAAATGEELDGGDVAASTGEGLDSEAPPTVEVGETAQPSAASVEPLVEAGVEVVEDPEPATQPEVPTDDEGLSLRERLTRAAAARHRAPGAEEPH